MQRNVATCSRPRHPSDCKATCQPTPPPVGLQGYLQPTPPPVGLQGRPLRCAIALSRLRERVRVRAAGYETS
jgi:hypothetical protein